MAGSTGLEPATSGLTVKNEATDRARTALRQRNTPADHAPRIVKQRYGMGHPCRTAATARRSAPYLGVASVRQTASVARPRPCTVHRICTGMALARVAAKAGLVGERRP